MKYIYLVNRFNFHNKTEDIIDRLKTVSDEMGRDYEIVVNDTVDDAKKTGSQFKDTEYTVTSIGGDGSVNLVLNDIVGTKNTLAYIPIGTGNDFYHANADDLKKGMHDVDIVKINGRYFINVACFGIDADIANDDRFIHNKLIPESMRYNAGVVYYFLTYKPKYLTLEIDGQTISQKVTTIVVANAKYYGGGYKVSPYGSIDDGMLEVHIVDALSKPKMAKIILSMKDASHLKDPAVRSFQTDKLAILAQEQTGANIDGEVLISDRFDIQIVPKVIKLDFDPDFIDRIREVKYK